MTLLGFYINAVKRLGRGLDCDDKVILSALSEVLFWIWVDYNQPVPDCKMAKPLMFLIFRITLGQDLC